MKKVFAIIAAAFMCLSSVTTLYACDISFSDSDHSHTYDQKTATSDYLKSEATCTKKAIYYLSCKCGKKGSKTFEYGEALGHDFGDRIISNGDGTHTRTCTRSVKNSDCNYSETESCHGGTATCTEKAICEDCGEEYGLASHNYNTEWTKTKTEHYHKCSSCEGKIDVAAHTPSAEATETTDQVCTICGYVITSALNHECKSHLTKIEKKAATCTQTGVKEDYYACTCGKFFKDENALTEITDKTDVIIPKLNHTYDKQVAMNKYLKSSATCAAKATYFYSCECGAKSETETFEHGELSNVHNYVNNVCSHCNKEYYSEGLSFKLNDDNASYSVSKGTCTDKDVVIPSVYNNLPVTIIDADAFKESESLTSVTLPSSIKAIGIRAFNSCKNLEKIIILDGVTEIGYDAFESCSALTSINIPSTITKIGSAAFYECKKLSSVYITDLAAWCAIEFSPLYNNVANPLCVANQNANSKTVENANLYICGTDGKAELVTELNIPDGVTKISDYAFCNCSNFTKISIPNTVTEIGDHAFYDCSAITGDNIPSNLKVIGNSAFLNCNGIKTLNIPSTVEKVGANAFANCDNLTSVNFDKTSKCTDIGAQAFESCDKLETITLPSGMTSIGDETFSGCFYLTAVTIPSNVKSVGKNAFYRCYDLANIIFEDNSKCESIGEEAFLNCEAIESLVIPNSVTSIGAKAFASCQKLKSLTVPFIGASVEATEENDVLGYFFKREITATETTVTNATYQYKKEETINQKPTCYYYHYYIPSSLTSVTVTNDNSIGSRAFYNCANLTNITIGDTVTEIEEKALYNCNSLTTLSIPFIGENKTATKYADVLGYIFGYTTLFTDKTTVNTIQYSVYSPNDYGTKYYHYYIPSSLTSVTVTDDTSIGENAFKNCSNLTEISLNSDLNSIKTGALTGCSSLATLTMPASSAVYNLFGVDKKTNSITTIKNTLKAIKTININGGTLLNYAMFYDCFGVETITLSASIASIGSEVFVGCANLTNINVDESSEYFKTENGNLYSKDGTTFVQYAIGKTDTAFEIPSTVTDIHDCAFYGSKLKNVSIPSTVKFIGRYAFTECINLDYNEYDNLKYLGNTQNPYLYLAECPTSVTTATVNPNCKFIGSQAFEECKITSIEIPNGVVAIGINAFAYCTALTSITIPKSVTYIEEGAFAYSSQYAPTVLEKVYYNGTLEDWCNIKFVYSYANPLHCKASLWLYNETTSTYEKVTSLTIPKSITKINEYAFSGCSSITTVTFEEGSKLISIGQNAFTSCASLNSVTLPNTLKEIGFGIFQNCTSLTNITFNGSKAEWETIKKDYNWDYKSSLTTVTCTDGTVSVSPSSTL